MKEKINISDKALEIINKEQLKPIPRWEFLAKNASLWLGWGLSIILLILGVGISWFALTDNIITPYFWIVVSPMFFGLAFLMFQRTKKAYKFMKWQVLVLIGGGALLIGGTLFKVGMASRIDRNLGSTIPAYRQMVPMKMVVWNNPEQGYLSGEITEINSTNNFQIKDFKKNTWKISGNTPLIRGRVKMEVGEEIKLMGKQTGTNAFAVDEVRPWN